MDVSEIRKLIDLMNENELVELEIEEEGRKVRLRKRARESEGAPSVVMSPAGLPVPANPTTSAAPSTNAEPGPPADSGTDTIRSPMVGTFYRSSSPDADPFIHEGDEVSPDTVTCIIEAMKVMNEIKAEISGTIEEILVPNGEPVEYGQPLFRVKPS